MVSPWPLNPQADRNALFLVYDAWIERHNAVKRRQHQLTLHAFAEAAQKENPSMTQNWKRRKLDGVRELLPLEVPKQVLLDFVRLVVEYGLTDHAFMVRRRPGAPGAPLDTILTVALSTRDLDTLRLVVGKAIDPANGLSYLLDLAAVNHAVATTSYECLEYFLPVVTAYAASQKVVLWDHTTLIASVDRKKLEVLQLVVRTLFPKDVGVHLVTPDPQVGACLALVCIHGINVCLPRMATLLWGRRFIAIRPRMSKSCGSLLSSVLAWTPSRIVGQRGT